MTEETGLSVLDFQAPRRAYMGPPHGCVLNEKTGVCARCDAGLLHKIHMAAAEDAYQQRRLQRQPAQPIQPQKRGRGRKKR
jgi:hypothetical protein